MYEPQPATVTLSGIPVAFPPGGFLQATEDGEAALVEAVARSAVWRRSVADLFAGLGTFALATRAAYAAEASRDAAAALKRAAPGNDPSSIATFIAARSTAEELKPFDAVMLDPPRAGAAEQVAELGSRRCGGSPTSAATRRPSRATPKTLADGGYRLEWVKPVGQFRWSTHVELAACFRR